MGQLKTEYDVWEMREDSECIRGESMMDNGNALSFFESIGIDKELVKFEDDNDCEWENG